MSALDNSAVAVGVALGAANAAQASANTANTAAGAAQTTANAASSAAGTAQATANAKVASDVGAGGVGMFGYMYNVSGAAMGNGAVVTGSWLQHNLIDSTGAYSSGGYGVGTWRCISGTVAAYRAGVFQRIA